jgi:hypothetical protein
VSRDVPGWVYVLTHPAWDKLGMVKIGKTGRNPRTRAAEITSVSGLLAPCTIAWCSPVSNIAAAENAVHRMLGDKRVRKRRELFRVDAATARQVVEAVAISLPLSRSPFASVPQYYRAPRRSGFRHYNRRPASIRVRMLAALVTIAALLVLLGPLLLP